MEHANDGGVGWREYVKRELADLNICWLDPCQKPTKDFIEDATTHSLLRSAKAAGDFEFVREAMRPIRCFDLRCTDVADFLIVHLDAAVPTFGTIEEITNANREKKPILVHIESGAQTASCWLIAMIPHELIFSTWGGLFQYVRHIAHDSSIDPMNRWFFFDFSNSDES
jgi:hypothetical protein